MKTIFIKSTFRNHNFNQLIEYYEKNLLQHYSNKVKIIHYRKIFKYRFSLVRFIDKLKLLARRLKKYDVIISDFYSPFVYTAGKKRIYIFHGALTKNHPSNEGLKNKKRLNYHRGLRKNTDYIITLAKTDKMHYLRHPLLEDIKLPEYLPFGLPRNDLLFHPRYIAEANEEIRKKYNLQKVKTILYAPTFRDYNPNKYLKICKNDIEALNKTLISNNQVMIYRPHYFSGVIDIKLIENQSNIILIDSQKEGDTQKLLCACDALITDYSSVFIDYLILQRPILFFPFDLEYYKSRCGLTIDFSNPTDIPGQQVYTLNELFSALVTLTSHQHIEIASETINRYFAFFDSKSAERIWNYILGVILKLNSAS